MSDTASAVLAPWSNFYVITGSAAAGLTGLMFVVITLVAGVERSLRRGDGIATFSTPTVVHFCVALLLSAVLSAPWHSLRHTGVIVGFTGVYGVVYVLHIIYMTMRQTTYEPEIEDWIWYSLLPLLTYLAIVGCALLFVMSPVNAMVGLAACVLVLIFIGIHNAWDVVTYIATGSLEETLSGGRKKDDGR